MYARLIQGTKIKYQRADATSHPSYTLPTAINSLGDYYAEDR
jgi:hypothetical protein